MSRDILPPDLSNLFNLKPGESFTVRHVRITNDTSVVQILRGGNIIVVWSGETKKDGAHPVLELTDAAGWEHRLRADLEATDEVVSKRNPTYGLRVTTGFVNPRSRQTLKELSECFDPFEEFEDETLNFTTAQRQAWMEWSLTISVQSKPVS